MRIQLINVLHFLVPFLSIAQARALSQSAISRSDQDNGHLDLTLPLEHRRFIERSQPMIIHGLPYTWEGVFKSISTIQPPLPISIFSNFFLQVAQIAHTDAAPARPYQRFVYGALVLEFIPKNGRQVVTKEFVEAAAMWLMHAAQNGWAEFFEAWVMDPFDMDTVYVHVVNYWDTMMK